MKPGGNSDKKKETAGRNCRKSVSDSLDGQQVDAGIARERCACVGRWGDAKLPRARRGVGCVWGVGAGQGLAVQNSSLPSSWSSPSSSSAASSTSIIIIITPKIYIIAIVVIIIISIVIIYLPLSAYGFGIQDSRFAAWGLGKSPHKGPSFRVAVTYLWLVGNGRMVVIVVIIVPLSSIPY